MSGETDAGSKRGRTAKTKLDGVVAVCAKCGKRQGLGRGALCRLVEKGAKRARPDLRLRVVETGCLGPCPKRALALATGPGLARGRVRLLDPGAGPAEIERVLRDEFASPISAPLPV